MGSLLESEGSIFRDLIDTKSEGITDKNDSLRETRLLWMKAEHILKLINFTRFTFITLFVLFYMHKIKHIADTEEFDSDSEDHFVTLWARTVRGTFLHTYANELTLHIGNVAFVSK